MHASQNGESAPATRGRTIHWASLYDVVVRLLFLGKEREFREMVVELAGVQPGDRVLDLGCGTGSLTMVAGARVGPGGEVHGIDAAPEMIDVARHKAAKMEMEADFRVGLIEDIPFPDDYFDLVLSSFVLHHLPDDLKRKGFVETYRVLKPGGRFVAVDFEPPTTPWLRHLTMVFFGHDMLRSDLQALAAMLEEASFVAVEGGRTRYRVISFLRGKVPA